MIDMITVNLDIKHDCYVSDFSNLGLKGIPIDEEYPTKYDRLLCGGIWCIVQLDYEFVEEEKKGTPIHIRKLTPIQMPHVDIDELKLGRKAFTKDEWIEVLLRSIGMEPDELQYREKWLLLTRMLPLIENNFNLCELGPRSTGKSHLFNRQQWQICFITCLGSRWGLLVSGIVWHLMKWPASDSKIKMACRS